MPAGTYLVVDTEPETPEGLTLDSGVNADGLVESEPVFFGVTLIGPDGKPVNTGAEVTIATRIPLPAEEGKITKVKEVKVYHIGEQGEAEPLEGVSYSLAEGVISDVTFTTPRFSLFAVTYTVEYIEKDKTYAIVGGGVISLRELLEALGVQQIQTEEIENVAFSNEELVKVVQVDEDTTAGELKRKLELSPSYSAELTEKDIAAMDALPLTAPDWALISLAPFKTDEKLIITLTDGQQYEIAVTDGQIVRYYIDAKGDTYEITVTFEDEANIPSTAELDVEEILPENEEYADYLAQALEALGGLEPAADQFARFFDITILDAGEKVTPKAPVTVSIRLTDAPAGEELKVVHFDEADGPVVMQTEAVENGENENTENAYVWFETESFSVYGVIVAPSRPSGVNDLDGQMCTISHTKNNKTHYIKSTVLDEQVDKLDKTENQSEASVWQFEFAGVAGQYYISTIVDGVKQYMHLDQVDENNAHGTLSDTPQQFTIEDVGNGLYRLYVVIGDQTYYLNEFNGGNGFAGWHIRSDADDKMALNFTSNPTLKDVEQYMLITQYEGEYYIVLNDGRLEKAESISGNPLSGEFTTPMTWTWDGSHLFHNSLAVGYTGDQRASDYYRRYIDPSAATGLSQEHGKYANGEAADPEQVEKEKNNTVYVTVEPEGQPPNKTVSDRSAAMHDTSFSISAEAQFKIYSGSDYMGVERDADGNLRLSGKKGEGQATNFWFADVNGLSGQSYVTLEMVDYPVDGEQYYLVIRYKDGNNYKYRIINPDRSLSAPNVAQYQNQLTFATPDQMKLWTYSGNESSSQISSSYNGQTKYLNPYNGDGITNSIADSGGNDHLGVKTDHDNSENGQHQVRGYGPRFFSIDNNQLRGEQTSKNEYEVHFAKLIGANDMHYSDNGFPAMGNHMVNHIDISIQGLTEVNVPLNQGVYQYRDAETGELRDFNVSSNTTLSLRQKVDITEEDIKKGTVEAYVEKADGTYKYKDNLFTITGYSTNEKTEYSTDQVRIEGNFKVADLQPRLEWNTRDSNQTRQDRLDNKVYYTVTVTKPVTFPLIDKDRGQIYNSDGEPLSITLDMTYSASFNYWDWNGVGAEHNNECPPLQPGSLPTINGNDAGEYIAFYTDTNNSFVKWQGVPNKDGYIVDPGGNYIYRKKGSDPQGYPEYCNDSECGNHPNDWERVPAPYKTAGGIGGWGNSGMDFVLGGDAGDVDSKVVALNITKKVVDEQGNLISVQTPMTNVFDIYYNRDAEENSVASTSTPVWNEKTKTWQVTHNDTTGFYNGYTKLHSKEITVGSAGMGLIYDYSVKPGMFYIEESNTEEDLPRKILDTKNQEWEYVKTYIETEYVWRNNGDKEEMFHVTADYTDSDTSYRSIPDVLGEYHLPNGNAQDENGVPYRNGFLRYCVYNVYKPKPINIQVEKKWAWQNDNDTPAVPTGASINVTLGRYRLDDIQDYTANGTLTITDSFTGIDAGYDAMYIITYPDGSRVEKYYANDYTSGTGIVLTGLKGGQYVISKVVPGKDNYSIQNDSQKIIVDVPQNGNGAANFNQTQYTEITNPNNWVTVGIRISYPFDDGGTTYNDSTFNTGLKMKVPANSNVEFTYRTFQAYDSQNQPYQANAGYWIYDWTTGGTPHWECRGNYQNCPNGEMVTVPVYDKDVCIMILYGDENVAPSMGIRFRQAEQSGSTNAANRFNAPRANSIVNKTQANAEGIPASPIEGMQYVVDTLTNELGQHTSTPWQKRVTLNNDNNWKDWFKEGSQKLDLEEYDERGNRYVYYIANVEEFNIPAETQIVYDRSYTTTVDSETGVATYTFTITNRMPDKTKVRIKKVSEVNSSTTLSGAVFELYKQNGSGYEKVREAIVTGADGYSPEIEVSRGHYKLVETQAPYGYIKTGSDPEFDVVSNSSGEIVVTYSNSETNEILVQNKPVTGQIIVNKIVQLNSVNTNVTDNKTFTVGLYKLDTTTNDWVAVQHEESGVQVNWTETITVDANSATGMATFAPLTVGEKYRVYELDGSNTIAQNALYQEYKVTYGDDNGVEVTVTDAVKSTTVTNNKETTTITATKTWGDGTSTPPAGTSITWTITATTDDGVNDVTSTVLPNGETAAHTANEAPWTTSWSDLPKVVGGKAVTYTVAETAATYGAHNYTSDEIAAANSAVNTATADTFAFTNPLPTIDIPVLKTWTNGTFQNGVYVKIGLFAADGTTAIKNPNAVVAEGETAPDYVLTINYDATSSTWPTASFTGLPMYDASGNAITYKAVETEVKLGRSTLTDPTLIKTVYGNEDGSVVSTDTISTVTITNTVESKSYKVKKAWGNGQAAPEGAEIVITLRGTIPAVDPTTDPTTVDLNALGVTKTTATVNGGLTGGDDTTTAWEYEWTGLPKYDNAGNEITYSATETSYKIGTEIIDINDTMTPTYTSDATYQRIVTNKIPTTSIKAKKNWANGATPPANTTVTLEITATVPNGSGETTTPAGVTISPASVTLDGTTDSTETTVWEYEWANLPKYDTAGKLITYTVTETAYTIGGVSQAVATADSPATEGYQFSFTNSLPSTDIRIVKVEQGSTTQLNGAQFQLKKYNGTEYVNEGSVITVNGTHTFTGLTDGQYKIVETQAPAGYNMMSQEITFTITGGTVITNNAATISTVEYTAKRPAVEADPEHEVEAQAAVETDTFTVGNTPGVELPSTGGTGTLPYPLTGLTLLLGASLWLLLRRRREQN